MEPLWIAILVLNLIAVVACVAILLYRAEKRRTESIEQVAIEMGFDFMPVGDKLFISSFGALPLFNKGHSKKAKNVLRKSVRGAQVTVLDYQYTIGAGKSQHTHKVTAVVFHLPEHTSYPDFTLQPEGFWHKVGSFFGYQDIDFASHPNFSSAYLLRGPNEAAIRAQFTPGVLEFFENEPAKWWVEAKSGRLATYRMGRVKPEMLRQFLTDATRLFLLFAAPSMPDSTAAPPVPAGSIS